LGHRQEEDVEACGAHEIEIELEDDGEDALAPPPVDNDHPDRFVLISHSLFFIKQVSIEYWCSGH